MKANEYLLTQVESMWYLQDSVCNDMADDFLMKMPPGTVSPIGVIWLHMVNEQDNFISTITGQSSLWKSKGWRERFGLDKAPNMGDDWSKYEHRKLEVELIREYSNAVRELTRKALETTNAKSLDETIKFFTDNDPKANVWVLMIGHTLLHCGEIAAIKGVLGGKGLPF